MSGQMKRVFPELKPKLHSLPHYTVPSRSDWSSETNSSCRYKSDNIVKKVIDVS